MEMRVCCKKSICVGRLLGGLQDRTPCTASCLEEGAENWASSTSLRKRKQSELNWGRKAGKVLVRGNWTSRNERGLLGQVLVAEPKGQCMLAFSESLREPSRLSTSWGQDPSGAQALVGAALGGLVGRRAHPPAGDDGGRSWPQPEQQGRGAARSWARARGGGQAGCAITKRLMRPRGWAGAQLPPPPSIVRRR